MSFSTQPAVRLLSMADDLPVGLIILEPVQVVRFGGVRAAAR
ncbi:hypothetical protein [Streptomyces niveus]